MSQKELSRCLSHTEIFRAQQQFRALPYLPVIPGSQSPLWLQSGGPGRTGPCRAGLRGGRGSRVRPGPGQSARRRPAVRCKGSG